MITIIGFVVAGQADHRRVMKVVVPQCVQTVPACVNRPDHAHILRLILANHDYRAIASRDARGGSKLRQDMLGRLVPEGLRRIEAKAVHMISTATICPACVP